MKKMNLLNEEPQNSACCGGDCCGHNNADLVILKLPYDIPAKIFNKIINRKDNHK